MHVSEPYDDDIAAMYDLLVEGREDAEAEGPELAFVRRALRDVCRRPVRDVLDAGCGTGKHLIPLVRDGLRLTGVDYSGAMIRECRRKLDRRGLDAELRAASLLELESPASFDAALAMNSVFCYLAETEAIVDGLQRLYAALRPGGLLLIDNANVLAQWVTFDETYWDKRIGKTMRVEFQERRHFEDFTALLHLEVKATVHASGRSNEIHNEDLLRVMTVGELTCYLKEAGFRDVQAYPTFDFAAAGEPSGDRMIFLARRGD
jgi:SAM-dependent methyltransferase